MSTRRRAYSIGVAIDWFFFVFAGLAAPAVLGEQHARQTPERVVSRQRLLGRYVKHGAPESARLQGRNQGGLIGGIAAAHAGVEGVDRHPRAAGDLGDRRPRIPGVDQEGPSGGDDPGARPSGARGPPWRPVGAALDVVRHGSYPTNIRPNHIRMN